jgi:hypothetical protein
MKNDSIGLAVDGNCSPSGPNVAPIVEPYTVAVISLGTATAPLGKEIDPTPKERKPPPGPIVRE